jgi:hypothetical protein
VELPLRGLSLRHEDENVIDKDSCLIRSVDTSSANVHDITRAAQQLQGNMEPAETDLGFLGIKN